MVFTITQSNESLDQIRAGLKGQPQVEKTPEYEKTATAAKEIVEREAPLGKWQSVLALYKEEAKPFITEEDVYAALGFSEKPQPEEILNPKDFPDIDQSNPEAYQEIFKILQKKLHTDKAMQYKHGKEKGDIVSKIIIGARDAIRDKREKAKEQKKQPTQKSG